MFDDLDLVPWAELEHAYGSAVDVPRLIRALGSAEAEVRNAARLGLYGNVFHQGTRYQASAPAARFLLELLADPATADRLGLLELTTPQRQLVQALAASPSTWRFGHYQPLATHEFGNFTSLIGRYGLPRSHTAMQAYISTATGPLDY
jgi:hypothetical protein